MSTQKRHSVRKPKFGEWWFIDKSGDICYGGAMKIYPQKPPRLLDLFCGAGAVSVGYADAGWEVVGVDIRKQPNYPFEFHQFDAMKVVQSETLMRWLDVDVVHASPPCQSYSFPTRHLSYGAPRLVDPLREWLLNLLDADIIKGYVIENVIDAPLLKDRSIMLCGTMFGKQVYRHRLFEAGGVVYPLEPAGFKCDHSVPAIDTFGGGRWKERNGNMVPVMQAWMEEMFDGRAGKPGAPILSNGIEWSLTQEEAKQAVPICYTEYIGLQAKYKVPVRFSS